MMAVYVKSVSIHVKDDFVICENKKNYFKKFSKLISVDSVPILI
jgi:hypothetical protein